MGTRARRYGERGGVNPRSLIRFFRTDTCRFFIIGKKRKDEQCWEPWMIKAIEGHTIEGVDVQESACYLRPNQWPLLPAMCHGITQQATTFHPLFGCITRWETERCVLDLPALGCEDRTRGNGRAKESRQRLCL